MCILLINDKKKIISTPALPFRCEISDVPSVISSFLYNIIIQNYNDVLCILLA